MDGNVIKEWNNLIELSENGFSKPNILMVCSNKRKTHAGFIWKYKSDYD